MFTFAGLIALLLRAQKKTGESWRTPVHALFSRPAQPTMMPMVPSPTVGRTPLEERKESFPAHGQPHVGYAHDV
jgi:hypothetical protein